MVERLSPLREQPDGLLCIETLDSHFVVVTKEGSRLRLGILEADLFSTVLVQSFIDLEDPFSLAGSYTQGALLGLLWVPQPQSVYVAGLGGGRFPTVLHHYFPQCQIDCTEISAQIVSIATQYFGLPQDPRFNIILQDGRQYLEHRAAHPPYDLIFVDICWGNGFVPYSFVTREFYQLCRDQLSSQGILVINFLLSTPYLTEKIKTLSQVFEAPIYYHLPQEGNGIMLAPMDRSHDLQDLRQQARCLQQHSNLPLETLAAQIRPLESLVENLPQWQEAAILTDADPPVAYSS